MYNPTVAGVSFVNYAGVLGNAALFYQFPPAPDGDQVGVLAGASPSIALSVSGLVPGSTYVVKFSMAKGGAYNAAPILVTFDGAALGSYTPAATSFTQITTASFTATAASGSLTFATVDGAGKVSAIDKLSMVIGGAENSGPKTVTFTYDVLGRLVATSTEGSVNGGLQTQTSYDPAGNRTNHTVSGAPAPPP